MHYLILFFMLVFCVVKVTSAEIIHVDINKGNDTNSGSSSKPLKTIQKAVEVAGTLTGSGAVTIKVGPGLYALDKGCLITSKRVFSEKDRFTIEAALLPDDAGWKPEDMPVIITSQNPQAVPGKPFAEIWSLDVETSHVTIRGLKFLGSPLPRVLYYPVYRIGYNLDDLVVSQCMFLCDKQFASSNVAVIANGHGLKIDHCVFYNCANAAVYWNAEGGISRNNSMTHCIISGGYVSGVWLCQTAGDFEFRNNIITNCLYAMMRSDTNKNKYTLSNSIINDCSHFSGKSDNNFNLSESGTDMPYIEKDIVKTGEVLLEDSPGIDLQVPRRHLHVKEGTAGFNLKAGLFTR